MPSPVLMLALVVNGKTLPHPPVASTTARAVIALIRPEFSSTATTPCTRPSSTSRRVTNHSSYRASLEYFSEVWNSACSMWKPVLSAANQVRMFFMPPNARTATRPFGLPAPGAAPVLELEELARCLVDERLDRVLVAEPVAPGDRVVDVLLDGVVVRDHASGAALGGHRVAAHGIDLRHHGDVESGLGLGDRDGRAEAGRAAADQEYVVVGDHGVITHPGVPRRRALCRGGPRSAGGRCRRGTPRGGSGNRRSTSRPQ